MLSVLTGNFEQNDALIKALAAAGYVAQTPTLHVVALMGENSAGDPLTAVLDDSTQIQAVQAALAEAGYSTTAVVLAEQINFTRAGKGGPLPPLEEV